MNSAKLDNQLNLALNVSEETRSKTIDLDVGFNQQNNTWELIIKYSGSLDRIREELNLSVTELISGYAIITIEEYQIPNLIQYEEIEFIEKPKRLTFAVNNGRAASCINPLSAPPFELTGKGVLIGIVDSGERVIIMLS